MEKHTLSVAMITYNEAKKIAKSLESVKFADEIILVDRGSTDDTVTIANDLGAKVIHQEWLGFGKQKNVAINHCTSDWILSLDADEVITPESKKEIEAAMANGTYDGYYFPRLAFFADHPLRHGGWYPDYQLRLVKRDQAKFQEIDVHERMVEPKKVGYLKQPMDHYTYDSIAQWADKMNVYTTTEAEKIKKTGRNPWSYILLRPPYRFIRNYILKAGFLDGKIGFIYAMLNAYYDFIAGAKALTK